MYINEKDALIFIETTEKINKDLRSQLASEHDFSKYSEKIYDIIPETEEEALLTKIPKVDQIMTIKVTLSVGYNKAHDVMKWFIAKGYIKEVKDGRCTYIYKGEQIEPETKEGWFD